MTSRKYIWELPDSGPLDGSEFVALGRSLEPDAVSTTIEDLTNHVFDSRRSVWRRSFAFATATTLPDTEGYATSADMNASSYEDSTIGDDIEFGGTGPERLILNSPGTYIVTSSIILTTASVGTEKEYYLFMNRGSTFLTINPVVSILISVPYGYPLWTAGQPGYFEGGSSAIVHLSEGEYAAGRNKLFFCWKSCSSCELKGDSPGESVYNGGRHITVARVN